MESLDTLSGGSRFKQSKYNIYLQIDKNSFLLYNTFSRSCVKLDLELKKAIQKIEEGKEIPSNILQELKEQGIIVNADIDERKILKHRYFKNKFNTKSSSFTLLTTYACNLACSYCYEGSGKKIKDRMNSKMARSVIKFIKRRVSENRSKKLDIIFYGGEPLLNYNICLEFLGALNSWTEDKEINLRSRVVTNGTLLDEKKIEEFKKLGCRDFQITLHGSREIHDRVRVFKNGKPTYDLLMEVLGLLKVLNCSPSICINVDKKNVNSMGRLFDDIKKRNFQDIPIAFSPILPVTEACSDYASNCLSENEMNLFLDLWKKAKRKGLAVSDIRATQTYCDLMKESSYVIDPKGNLYKCWNQVGLEEHKVGSIGEQGEMNVLFPYYNIMTRDPFQIKECKDCKLLPQCLGGCLSRSYYKYQTYHAPGCHGERGLTKEMVAYLGRE